MTLVRRLLATSTDRRRGWLAVLAGAVLVLAIQVAAPVGVPLYDGVVVQEPYRYLHPTGDHVGSPTSGSRNSAAHLHTYFRIPTGTSSPCPTASSPHTGRR